MEFSRKTATTEQIHDIEKDLWASVQALTSEFEPKFSELGYTLETEQTRDNENLEGEEREALRASGIEETAASYEYGYTSTVKITVKRKKTEEELLREAEEEADFENSIGLSEEEAENERNDRIFKKANRELERSIAFTTILFVRVYKTFWIEKVSVCENTDELRADLDEFLTVLTEKSQNGEVC